MSRVPFASVTSSTIFVCGLAASNSFTMPVTMLSRIVRSKRIAEWCANAATGASASAIANNLFIEIPPLEPSTVALPLTQTLEMLLPRRLVALVRQQANAGLELPLLFGRDRLRIELGIRHRHLRRQHLGAVVVRDQRILLDDLRVLAMRIAPLVDGFFQMRRLDDELVAFPAAERIAVAIGE